MPLNPLTPPNEPSSSLAAGLNFDAVDGAVNNLAHSISQQFASPISNVNIEFDEKSEMEDQAESQDMSNGEKSMSDGGAPLGMAHAQAEQVDVELVIPDIQMSQDTFDAVLVSSHFPATLEDVFPGSPSFQQPHLPEMQDSPDDSSYYPSEMPAAFEIASAFSLPVTMSAVSLQLQHFQDQDLQDQDLQEEHLQEEHLQEEHLQESQDHVQSAAEAEIPNHVENSTASISYQIHNPMSIEAGTAHSGLYLSLAELATSSNTQVSEGGHSSSYTSSIAGSDPSIAPSIMMPSLGQQSNYFIHVNSISYPHFSWTFFDDNMLDDESQDEADNSEVRQQPNNLHLVEFLQSWNNQFGRPGGPTRRPKGNAITALIQPRNVKLPSVQRCDLQGERGDIQGINWLELGVTRLEARQMRRHTYINYTSLPQNSIYSFSTRGMGLCDDQNFFRFRKIDFEHNIRLSHFQLRNLLACSTRDHIFYAGPARVLHCNPQSNERSYRATVAMDLTDPIVHPFHSAAGSFQITTLAEGHDVLVAGGYDGEYSLMNIKASRQMKHTEGLITDHENSITNHVQVHLSRGSSLPLATFASNDHGVRILDINTNKFVAEHSYDFAINCTAISPDQRLRVLVGDTCQVMICNAATGEVLQSLEGHRDYGFACDWADDGWTVATGNQDKQVKIWDARKWTNSAGIAQPITTILATMAGVRRLKFSPLGSGKRVLVAAEPADIVDVIDGEIFATKQTLSFFGEIGGFDFTNDGQDLIVANCDPSHGGLMEFERCDFSRAPTYLGDYKESRFRSRATNRFDGYDRDDADEDLTIHARSKGTDEQRRRRPANLGISMGLF